MMPKHHKYLYTDGILKGKENLIFLILNEKEPSGLFGREEKLQRNPLCASLDQALFYLKEMGYQTPSQEEVKKAIHQAFENGCDFINIEIPFR
jgi:pyruvate formate-lyase activating enzyme-like uncharacterized protein